MTVTRSPLPTEAAVRSASRPKAVTLTHRVMLSPPRAGGQVHGQAQLDAVGAVAGGEGAGVIAEAAGDGDADRVHGVPPWCGDREGWPPWWRPGTVGPFPAVRCPRRARAGPATGQPGQARCFPAAGKEGSAGAAGTERPRPGKDLCLPGAARGRLRGPTARRKLTRPGWDEPQSSRQRGQSGSRPCTGVTPASPPITDRHRIGAGPQLAHGSASGQAARSHRPTA